MKIVHAADLHIDSPLRGLDRYDGAPVDQLRGATRRALENLVALCIDLRADVLLLAGDVYDGSWKDYSTGLFFATQMTRLREADIPVVLVRGNHDALSSITKQLVLPTNVEQLSPKKPTTFELKNVGVAVHGQSFSERIMSDDLASKYPARVAGVFNIGLLHTSIDGREGHAPYAPTSIEVMRAKGYHYWALGHVHAREVVSTEPYIVYPGNLQGRHARETGSKGASILTVEDNVVENIEHRALDVVRWDAIQVDTTAATDVTEVIDLVRASLAERSAAAEGRLLAARVTLTGRTQANSAIRRNIEHFVNELRSVANDTLGGDGVWLEKVQIHTHTHLDFDRIREEASAVGHLARRLVSIKNNDGELAELALSLVELEKKLPPELREGENAFRLSDPAVLRALVDDVEEMLVPRLLEGAELP